MPAVVGTGLARSTVSLDGTMLERAVLGPGGVCVCVQMQNKGYIHVPGAHRESVRSLPPSRARITGVLALAGAERRRRRMEGGRGVWLG